MRGLDATAPGWLTRLREDSQARFESLGYPTKKIESWRYTSMRPIASATWGTANQGQSSYESPVQSSAQLVFVNGFLHRSTIGPELAGKVSVRAFSEVLQGGGEELIEFFEHASMNGDEPFVALNASAFQDGAYVHVKAGADISLPIELVFIATEEAEFHPRVVVNLGPNSRATLLERFVSDLGSEASYLTNAVSQVHLGAGASLEHVRLQNESLGAYHISYTGVTQSRESSYVNHAFSLGGRVGRSEVQVRFDETGASCALNGLYAPTSGQNHDNYTVIDHAEPHCKSSEYYKAVVSNNATGSFQGRVLIGEGAVGSSSDQLNRNLLLGDAAVANTKPQLEIDNDDVKATHGSTVGRLDEDAVFYLMTRGLPKADAKAFLVRAFADEVIERVGNEDVKNDLIALYGARLAKVGSIA